MGNSRSYSSTDFCNAILNQIEVVNRNAFVSYVTDVTYENKRDWSSMTRRTYRRR